MASDFTIRAVNNWRATMHAQYSDALRVSMDVWRRDASEATKHMLILMAQSASAQAPKAAARRPVLRDERGEYVEVFRQGRPESRRYKWQFERPDARITWDQARRVGSRGLARRSWLWGLSKSGKPISGTSRVDQIRSGARMIGWLKENRLSYIDKIMPSGFETVAAAKATNKLMKQAEMKMVKDFEREIGRRP